MSSTAQVDIETRMQRLEDLEAVRDLTARYALATNRGFAGRQMDWDGFANVWTEDAVWNSEAMGIHVEGRDAVVSHLREVAPTVDVAMHSFTNPVIVLDGDTARGEWVMPIASIHDGQIRSIVMAATFDYRRTSNGWRICGADVDLGLMLAVDAPSR